MHVLAKFTFRNRATKQFQCPLCDMDSRKPTAYKACLHFLDHLGEERYFPYRCPLDECNYGSVQQSSVQMHCTGVHKMIWTDELVGLRSLREHLFE